MLLTFTIVMHLSQTTQFLCHQLCLRALLKLLQMAHHQCNEHLQIQYMPPVISWILYLGYLMKDYKHFISIRIVAYKMAKLLPLSTIKKCIYTVVKLGMWIFIYYFFIFNMHFQNTSPSNYILVQQSCLEVKISLSSCNICSFQIRVNKGLNK